VVAEKVSGEVVQKEAENAEKVAEEAAVHAQEAVASGEDVAEAVQDAVQEEQTLLLAHRKKHKQIRHDKAVKKEHAHAEYLKTIKAKLEAKKLARKGAIETAKKAAHAKFETKHPDRVKKQQNHHAKRAAHHAKHAAHHANHTAHAKHSPHPKEDETKAAKKDGTPLKVHKALHKDHADAEFLKSIKAKQEANKIARKEAIEAARKAARAKFQKDSTPPKVQTPPTASAKKHDVKVSLKK